MPVSENGYQIKLLSSLEKVFPDAEPACCKMPDLTMLRGETLSFQAAVKGPSPGRETVEVRVISPIRDAVRVRSVELVPSAYPCHPRHDENYLRTVPGMFPDLLRELDGGAFNLIAGQWRAVWIDVEAKADTPAGIWPVEISLVKSGEVLCRAAAKVEIFSPVLPEQTLRHTEWFYADCLADYYHTEVFSEAHWRLIENFMRAAVRRGVNMFLTPCFTPPLDTEEGGERTTVQLVGVDVKNGEYSFHFDRLHRWIDLMRKCGGKYIEIAHLFTQWGAHAAPKVMATVNGEYKRIFGWDTPAVGGSYTEFLKRFLPQLTKFLREQGVSERTYFHISDEPSEENIDSYLAAKSSVQKELENFKVIDALSSYEFYRRGIAENPVCSSDHIEPFLEHGVPHLWTYYCTAQCVGVSNRFMSQPSARNRILGIQLYKYGIDGFLHWGYNFYNSMASESHINPYAVTDAGGAYPSGDPFLVYPGPGGVPEESIRMMVLFDGLQDLRALRLLEQYVGHEKVVAMLEENLAEPITFSSYPADAGYLLNIRNRINREIMSCELHCHP